MNRDFVWEAEYGRRNHLRTVFKDLLNMQNANSLQCLGLYVNNNPYNLEFFVVVSYDQPNEDDLSYMQEKFIESGLVYRQDLTMLELTLQMGNRRFNSMTLIDAGMVDFVMDNFFSFAEIDEYIRKGYYMKPFGKENEVFISHSSKDKKEVENLLPYINGMDLPIWFDKYNIDVGQSIVEKVQEGVKNSYAVIFWVTDNFLESKWCNREMQAFIKRMIEEETLIVTILDENVAISSLPIFLQDIKCISRKEYSFDDIAKELSRVFKKNFFI